MTDIITKPIGLITKPIGLITKPISIATGIPVALTETVINLFINSPEGTTIGDEDANLYDIAAPKLDLCNLIYFYTELRSSTKKLIKEFAESKNVTYEVGREPSQLELLYNAISQVESSLENLEVANNPAAALADYKSSLLGLENLRDDLNLTPGDVQIFKQYFQIVSKKAKYNTDIKRDLHLYSDYIDPLFRVSFGGTDFNIKSVEDLVDRDPSSYLYYIDDDFTKTSLDPKGFINGFDSEIVYAIAISDKFETITVVFRGSVNANDWLTNVQVNMTDCLFPGFTDDEEADNAEKPSFGRVHEGFYKYLFDRTEAGTNGSNKSKGEEIMGKINSLLKGEKKGYKVFITGHSLGGALSTLMAARAAALDDIDSTVFNVSFASPFVGDQAFRENFYDWEQSKKVKHLRVSNYEDIVPLIPFSTLSVPRVELYKHTGINLKLFNKSLLHPFHYHISYPKEDSLPVALRNTMHSSIFNGFNLNITNHFGKEYADRLEAAKDDLKDKNLMVMYSDSSLTGWTYDDEDLTTKATMESESTSLVQ